MCWVMVSVRGGLGSEFSIVASHKPSGVLLIPLSAVILSELKMVTSFFVKGVDQLEFHSCPIEKSLVIFRFGYSWACVDSDGNLGRGIFL